MSEVKDNSLVNNIIDLVNTYFSKTDSTSICMPGFFLKNIYDSNCFQDITKKLDAKSQYFLLTVFRETPYEKIKELGDEALLWFYDVETHIQKTNKDSTDSGIFWFSPEEIPFEKISTQKLNELESVVKKYNLL